MITATTNFATGRIIGSATPVTQFVRESLGLPATHLLAPEPFLCPLCAGCYEAGTPAAIYTFGPNFNDYSALAGVFNRPPGESNQGKPYVCGNCLPFLNKPMLRLFAGALITSDGGFAIRGKKDEFTSGQVISHILLHPPKPPFVLTISAKGLGAMTHMIWRAVMVLDANYIRFRLDSRLLLVRRHKLENVFAIAQRLELDTPLPKGGTIAQTILEARARGEQWANWRRARPLFEGLIFEGDEDHHGRLNRFTAAKCTPSEVLELLSLSPGEHWALAYLCGNRPPVAPQKLVLPDLTAVAAEGGDE